ncbi:hypothetical protein ENUP19_0143G0012 [Entamoeba nuttalli]|uniref:Uncharacterized protein n=2 Tax=Entamoeba nuttalli TaxID=412467 RepID=K2GVX2_ENTNP|nr:hypothetical protein ENU1_135140 [Entamoeba nuttalli P19]EKE39278.1 hypothetical protein ENU1_135140 [Entamoeba nuttalli P19]|eukprot:XP_008858389.1 hypothetical protein ENU1_135140 [Entamoeba nuttalli P19]
MQLPNASLVSEFLLNYGFAFFSICIAELGCFGCLMYMFGVLCDRNPGVAKGITIFVWILTFIQSFLFFMTYPIYLPLLAIFQHLVSIFLVIKIPTIVILSTQFYIVAVSSGISQLVICYLFIFGSYQLHEFILVVITFQAVSILLLSSVQLNGERFVSNELSQSYNIMTNLAQKVAKWLSIKGGVLYKKN